MSSVTSEQSMNLLGQPLAKDSKWVECLSGDLKLRFDRLSQSSYYSHVSVLLINWEANNLSDVEPETRELDETFKSYYEYQTERWKIPSSSSSKSLEEKLEQFKNAHDGPLEILIIYYGGHAWYDRTTDTTTWVA